jgi:hypothetical protein
LERISIDCSCELFEREKIQRTIEMCAHINLSRDCYQGNPKCFCPRKIDDEKIRCNKKCCITIKNNFLFTLFVFSCA